MGRICFKINPIKWDFRFRNVLSTQLFSLVSLVCILIGLKPLYSLCLLMGLTRIHTKWFNYSLAMLTEDKASCGLGNKMKVFYITCFVSIHCEIFSSDIWTDLNGITLLEIIEHGSHHFPLTHEIITTLNDQILKTNKNCRHILLLFLL